MLQVSETVRAVSLAKIDPHISLAKIDPSIPSQSVSFMYTSAREKVKERQKERERQRNRESHAHTITRTGE